MKIPRCPECGAMPRTRPCQNAEFKDQFIAECSNGFDCDLWPITRPHPTREAARAAWIAGEAFEPAPESSPQP